MANPSFPISTAVVSWFYPAGTLHIRVYSSDGYNVTERCNDQSSAGWLTRAWPNWSKAVAVNDWVAAAATVVLDGLTVIAVRVWATVTVTLLVMLIEAGSVIVT